MDKVLVCCASRDRPFALVKMLESVTQTSPLADVAVYVDDDQQVDYAFQVLPPSAKIYFGPRLGPVKSLNELVRRNPGYLAYGAATDDCQFVTLGWDRWIIETSRSFKGGIGVMAPWMKDSIRPMDFPWATSNWINEVGWFAHPKSHHFYWDVILEILGDATQSRCAEEKEFAIVHDGHTEQNLESHLVTDMHQFAGFCAFERRTLIARLRKAIDRGTAV